MVSTEIIANSVKKKSNFLSNPCAPPTIVGPCITMGRRTSGPCYLLKLKLPEIGPMIILNYKPTDFVIISEKIDKLLKSWSLNFEKKVFYMLNFLFNKMPTMKMLTLWIILILTPGPLLGKQKIHINIQQKEQISFCYIDWFGKNLNTNEIGPDYEVAMLFIEQLKKKPIPKKIEWEELFQNSKGKVDAKNSYKPKIFTDNVCDFAAVALTQNTWREGLFKILPFYPGRTMVLSRTDDSREYKKIADLSGRKTSAVKETTYYQTLVEINETDLKGDPIKIIELNKVNTVEMLLAKEIDFMLADTVPSFYLMKKHSNKIKIRFPISANEKIGWAFKKEDSYLSSEYSKFINEQKNNQNSELNKIFIKYFDISLRDIENIVYSSLGDN